MSGALFLLLVGILVLTLIIAWCAGEDVNGLHKRFDAIEKRLDELFPPEEEP